MDRSGLLKQLDKAWVAFTESYVGLSEVELLEGGVVGDWSVRDVIAHVATWEEEALKYLPLIIEGGRAPRYSLWRDRRVQSIDDGTETRVADFGGVEGTGGCSSTVGCVYRGGA
jgi:hypothetical protein